MKRRQFLLGAATLLLTGCDRVTQSDWGKRILGSVEALNRRLQRLLTGADRMAHEAFPNEKPILIATGGLASFVEEKAKLFDVVDKDLVLKGMAMAMNSF